MAVNIANQAVENMEYKHRLTARLLVCPAHRRRPDRRVRGHLGAVGTPAQPSRPGAQGGEQPSRPPASHRRRLAV